MSKRKRRSMLAARSRNIDWDVVDLRSARHYFWMGDYKKAGKLLYALSTRIIVEPFKDTEEYRNGERKQDTPFEEQEQEKVDEEEDNFYDFFSGVTDSNNAEPERDEDGYIIR